MANNSDRETTYHEVPASRSWYLGDTFGPVTKSFLKIYTPTIFVLGVVLTLLTEHTNFWMILATGGWNLLFVKSWMITLPIIGITIVYLYVKHTRSQKRKKQASEIAARRRKLDTLLGGE